MKYKVLKTFKGATRGYAVQEYAEGEIVEIPDADLVSVSLNERWIAPVTDKPKPKAKAKAKAKTPTLRNKDAG